LRVTCGVEYRKGEGCGLVYDDAVQDTNCPGHPLVDGSILGGYCREHDFFGCKLHEPATITTDGEYIEPRRVYYDLPATVVSDAIAHLDGIEINGIEVEVAGEYTEARPELTDTQIVDRMVKCMPTINIDRVMPSRGAKRNMLIQLVGDYSDLEWIRAQLLKRATQRGPDLSPAVIDVGDGPIEPLPRPNPKLPPW
jgi:hypothetical protein